MKEKKDSDKKTQTNKTKQTKNQKKKSKHPLKTKIKLQTDRAAKPKFRRGELTCSKRVICLCYTCISCLVALALSTCNVKENDRNDERQSLKTYYINFILNL